MSAYGLLRNPYLFDPKRKSTQWTPERGIETSWEYLNLVKKYGKQRNGKLGAIHTAIGYHLQKFNTAFLESEREEGNNGKEADSKWERDFFETAVGMNKLCLSDLMRCDATTMNEWTACIEILEIMIGKKIELKRAKLPSKSRFKPKKIEEQLMAIARRAILLKDKKRFKFPSCVDGQSFVTVNLAQAKR